MLPGIFVCTQKWSCETPPPTPSHHQIKSTIQKQKLKTDGNMSKGLRTAWRVLYAKFGQFWK